MKSALMRVAVPAVFALLGAPSWAGAKLPMRNGPTMTAKEAKALVETAKTAKEHLKLARYFRQEAGQFEAEARDHEDLIAAYRKRPASLSAKSTGFRTVEHCEFLAKSGREMAKALREMAAAHEEMAKNTDE